MKFEDIKAKSQILGLIPNEVVTVIATNKTGNAVTVFFQKADGGIAQQMVFLEDLDKLSLAQVGRPWSFDSDGNEFKLALEAMRIQLSYLFDPMMAIHSSNIEPLPHQISAVYESMLPKQPLRFVLADDPGAGKTIMAGLLIQELIMRADSRRILIVSPGSLTEQWQDELIEKFGIKFDIFSKEKQEQSSSGNFFQENDLVIARVDQLARNEIYQQKLQAVEWDLVIIDEAHKLSASRNGNKINKTYRYRLGEMLGSRTRHFLLMTATPHNGKEAEFQLWLSLLDSDRFYGEERNASRLDVSDVMRRMVKEELLKFDGTKLFPERRTYTVNYKLSDAEMHLYNHVTAYVVDEMNRADNLDNTRKSNVGFALTMLQRRLASSPSAIYLSLKRRVEKLSRQLKELKAMGATSVETSNEEEINEDFEDDLSSGESESVIDDITNRATASRTLDELEKEIEALNGLVSEAKALLDSGKDTKWSQLSRTLQDTPEMRDASGTRKKLIIFTEHRDTLAYLVDHIKGLLGDPNAVVAIHGAMGRDERRRVQNEFRNYPEVLVLVATDAAGEGVNLQNANLMINYDLPWNPNRLEQRFGRVHRIGQTEICFLWSLVAYETREGMVFQRLFEKLEKERLALGGRVFDILGEAFENESLKNLLIKAIREGDDPEVKRRMLEKVENALARQHLEEICRRNMLIDQHMTPEMIYPIKEKMDRAEARKLQPCFIRSFFRSAFESLGGQIRKREEGRFEIPNVPIEIRQSGRMVGATRTPVGKKYERVCFDKKYIRIPGSTAPMAEFVHPGHPLMVALIDCIRTKYENTLKPGAILLDKNDFEIEPSLVFMIRHCVKESIGDKSVSERIEFVRMSASGKVSNAGYAPHLDLSPLPADCKAIADQIQAQAWINKDLETVAVDYATNNLALEHYQDVKKRREEHVDKVRSAVETRLNNAIRYWSNRYAVLSDEVRAGKQPRMQPMNAKARADELTARLNSRIAELEKERNVVPDAPICIGGMLVIPQGLVNKMRGSGEFCADPNVRKLIEQKAMNAVLSKEVELGFEVEDVSAEKCGWDITSRYKHSGDGIIKPNRHIEVKGRAKGVSTVTLTRNEICYAVNQSDKFILAIVLVDGDTVEGPYYVKNHFLQEPENDAVSISYDIDELIRSSVPPQDTL